ncbi:MAG TPA: TraR/DksA C4-type zinc finger protein [Marmoricola sp.]
MTTREDHLARLTAEREFTALRLVHLRGDFTDIVAASASSNADDEHDPEGATIAFERSQVQALIEQAERRLAEVDAALVRLQEGQYGSCVRCGEPIDPARLDARPSAVTCISCAH